MKVLDCIMEYGLKYSTWDFHILIRDRGLFNSREEHIERYLDKPVESYKITKHDLLIIRLEGDNNESEKIK